VWLRTKIHRTVDMLGNSLLWITMGMEEADVTQIREPDRRPRRRCGAVQALSLYGHTGYYLDGNSVSQLTFVTLPGGLGNDSRSL
jgi:hypothetical protein